MTAAGYLALGFALMIAPLAGMIWYGARRWRRGADRPWSQRVEGLFLLGVGALMLGLLVLLVSTDGPVPAGASLLITVAVGAVLALVVIEAVLRHVERRQARRVAVELGQPVPRRMLHPAVVAGAWVVAAVGVFLGTMDRGAAIIDGRVARGTITTQAEQTAAVNVLLAVGLTWLALAALAGTVHTLAQRYRRRREELAVRQLGLAAREGHD